MPSMQRAILPVAPLKNFLRGRATFRLLDAMSLVEDENQTSPEPPPMPYDDSATRRKPE
jgi:hypothetical protein